jgi:hypothetical protein
MRFGDTVLAVVFWVCVGGVSMISIGTFLVILEDGLFLNRKREAASNARRQAMYDAEGRVYREQERVRIQARNAEVSK